MARTVETFEADFLFEQIDLADRVVSYAISLGATGGNPGRPVAGYEGRLTVANEDGLLSPNTTRLGTFAVLTPFDITIKQTSPAPAVTLATFQGRLDVDTNTRQANAVIDLSSPVSVMREREIAWHAPAGGDTLAGVQAFAAAAGISLDAAASGISAGINLAAGGRSMRGRDALQAFAAGAAGAAWATAPGSLALASLEALRGRPTLAWPAAVVVVEVSEALDARTITNSARIETDAGDVLAEYARPQSIKLWGEWPAGIPKGWLATAAPAIDAELSVSSYPRRAIDAVCPVWQDTDAAIVALRSITPGQIYSGDIGGIMVEAALVYSVLWTRRPRDIPTITIRLVELEPASLSGVWQVGKSELGVGSILAP